MAQNFSDPIHTLPGNGTSFGTGTSKRKPIRKATPIAASSKKRSSPKSSEILFEDEPNPLQPPVPPYIWIDHPQQEEHLFAPEYVIRLGVGGAETVELSIDKEPWTPCRLTSGYWWYDWENFSRGKHTLVARMKAHDGRWFRTPPRSCEYR